MFNTQMKFGLCVVFALFLSLIGAESFDQYPMGCYTYMSNRNWGNNYTEAERAQILALISDMGYNVAQIDNRDGDGTFGDMLTMLSNNDLYAIVSDLYYPYHWISGSDVNYNRYNTNALTTSSYLKLEAEYSGNSDIDGGSKDINWYCSHAEHVGNMPRVGADFPDNTQRTWKCTRGTTNPGFAFTDIR
ncbi:MAG: hypothetical protein LHW56_05685 [Candidatus Cloacimonetes bacterium]|jgi:hypothetical protein|nr:hypothetical protein [Candidatus Cloacimonadota bacterium]MDY0172382.1 hypothetical protein [Candidatus Cloacimonadaceae bacterium]